MRWVWLLVACVALVGASRIGLQLAPIGSSQVARAQETNLFHGDANCDGVINSVDASLVLQHGASLFTLPGSSCVCHGQLYCVSCTVEQIADPNGDYHTDSLDALLILQFGAGLLPDRTDAHCYPHVRG